MIPDDEIIERVLRGRVEEYGDLIRRHQGPVFALALGMLGRREDAEDAVQEAFVLAYKKLAECRERCKFRAWLRRIAVNICLRRLAREVPTEELDELAAGDAIGDNPVEQEVLRRAELREIQDAITSLPAAYRTVLVLRYQQELELKEIAELLGERPGATYTRLHRARRMLAERLKELANEMC